MKKESPHILFKDNKGRKLILGKKLRLEDLVRLGVKEIRLRKKGDPLPDNWFANVDE